MKTVLIAGIAVQLIPGPFGSWVSPGTDVERIKLRHEALEARECHIGPAAKKFFEGSTRKFNIADQPCEEYRWDWRR